ncbi:hypothetical protein A1OU_20380 [Enterovibrio norvegicus]|nr:hypothetical protein A1OU_20380 [Enterovibrio norvegicus]
MWVQQNIQLYANNLKMLDFRGHQCVQFKANSFRDSHSISQKFNDEVDALRASLRASLLTPCSVLSLFDGDHYIGKGTLRS